MRCTAVAWMLAGPRLALLAWRFFNPAYVGMAFSSAFWGFLGWLLTPWTSLFYINLYPGGLIGTEWLFLGVGLMADAATYYGVYLNGPVIYVVEVTQINAEDDPQQ